MQLATFFEVSSARSIEVPWLSSTSSYLTISLIISLWVTESEPSLSLALMAATINTEMRWYSSKVILTFLGCKLVIDINIIHILTKIIPKVQLATSNLRRKLCLLIAWHLCSFHPYTDLCKRDIQLFEFPILVAAWIADHLMHRKSDRMQHFQAKFTVFTWLFA